MPLEDMQIISVVFADSVISEGFGKLCAPSPPLARQIKQLMKVGARGSYHARWWHVHVASAFPLSYHYRPVLPWDS
jgi:hypothetical protein